MKVKMKLLVFAGSVRPTVSTNPEMAKSVYGPETILGAYFSESQEVALSYPVTWSHGEKRYLITANINIDNPIRFRSINGLRSALIKAVGHPEFSHRGWIGAALAYREILENQGHDGITYLEGFSFNVRQEKARVWVAFHSSQIEVLSVEEQNSDLEIHEALRQLKVTSSKYLKVR